MVAHFPFWNGCEHRTVLSRCLQPCGHARRNWRICFILGLGGWLSIDGSITQYFASQLKQVWEALASLVTVDLWASAWKQQRVVLQITGDNVIALTPVTRMRPHSPTLAIIASELALRLVDLSFPPDAQHTPGVGHIFADKLSRVFSPTGKGVLTPDLHPAMTNAQVAEAPVRDASLYQIEATIEPASGN